MLRQYCFCIIFILFSQLLTHAEKCKHFPLNDINYYGVDISTSFSYFKNFPCQGVLTTINAYTYNKGFAHILIFTGLEGEDQEVHWVGVESESATPKRIDVPVKANITIPGNASMVILIEKNSPAILRNRVSTSRSGSPVVECPHRHVINGELEMSARDCKTYFHSVVPSIEFTIEDMDHESGSVENNPFDDQPWTTTELSPSQDTYTRSAHEDFIISSNCIFKGSNTLLWLCILLTIIFCS